MCKSVHYAGRMRFKQRPCPFIARVLQCVSVSVCESVSSDSPGGTPGAGCRGDAASSGVAAL